MSFRNSRFRDRDRIVTRRYQRWVDSDSDGIPDWRDSTPHSYTYQRRDDHDLDGIPNWRDPDYLNISRYYYPQFSYYSSYYPTSNYLSDPSCVRHLNCVHSTNNKYDCHRCITNHGQSYNCANVMCSLKYPI